MLLNLYRSKTPISVFSLPILIGLLAIPILVVEQEPVSFVFEWQNNLWTSIYQIKLLHYLLVVLIISNIAHWINNVYNTHGFYSKNSYLPGFIYVLCLLSFDAISFTPMLFAHLFLVLGLRHLFKLRRQEDAKTIMFWSGFFFGLSAILAPFQIVLIFVLWLALAIFRPFVWREWIMVFLGAFIPFFYFGSFMFMFKGYIIFPAPNLLGFDSSDSVQLYEIINATFFGLIIIGSLFKYAGIVKMSGNRFKKQSQVLLHFSWLSLGSFLVAFYFYNLFFLALVIPLSIFIGTQLLHSRNSSVVNGIVIIWLIISLANVLLGY